MHRCVDIRMKAGQQYSVQTLGQQVYAIVHQIKLSRPFEFKIHIIRLGGFQPCFIFSLGKLWGNGGLVDLLFDLGVYAACTIFFKTNAFWKTIQFWSSRSYLYIWGNVVAMGILCCFHLIKIPNIISDGLLMCYYKFSCDMSSCNQDIRSVLVPISRWTEYM